MSATAGCRRDARHAAIGRTLSRRLGAGWRLAAPGGRRCRGPPHVLRSASLALRGTGPTPGAYSSAGWHAVDGYDPAQLLSPDDLRRRIRPRGGPAGVYVAPSAAIALRQAHERRDSYPFLSLSGCSGCSPASTAPPADQRIASATLDHRRRKIADELGLVPAVSAETLRDSHVAEYGRPPRRWPVAGQR